MTTTVKTEISLSITVRPLSFQGRSQRNDSSNSNQQVSMQVAAPHAQEGERLAALRSLDILDTGVEAAYDDLVRLAAELTGSPIALISLVDENRQWFKARYGLDAFETARDIAFCSHAIHKPDEAFVVEDASNDERFDDNPLVTGDPNIRFYAGIPLKSPQEQLPLGTLCVIDSEPHQLAPEKLDTLKILARQVEVLFALREKSKTLEQQNEQLAQATQAKSRFLSAMSHDIRTPLNGIVGVTDLLEAEISTSEGREFLSIIQECSDSLLNLVNDILDLSKIESGSIEILNEPFSLRDFLDNLCSIVRVRAQKKGLDLTVLFKCEIDIIRGDERHLHQIVLNLLNNAVKFTEKGSVRIEVSKDSRGPNDQLTFTISDTGRGISDADIQRLGQPFTQVGSSKNEQQEGSGLGLNIVKSLVSAMDGTFEVQSKLGSGSDFKISLSLPSADDSTGSPSPR